MSWPRRSTARFWLLQAALCAILAGCIALAAIVRQQRLAAIRVKLEKPSAIETAQVVAPLPRGWTIRNSAPGQIMAEEEGGFRQLVIARQRGRDFLSPLQWMRREGLLPTGGPAQIDPARVGSWPGVLVRTTQGPSDHRGGRLTAAATVLPTGDAVAIVLSSQGRPDASDEDLVRRAAESLRITGAPAPAPAAAEFTLDHLRVRVPEHFVTAPLQDPYRTGLRLVADDADGWLGLELVPCVFPEGDGAEAFAAMMACRDHGAPVGAITPLSSRAWQCRSAATASITTTYLLTQSDGQALLAEFRGNEVDSARIDALWRQIAAGVRFSPQIDLATHLKRGAELAAKLREGIDQSALAPAEQRWLWYDQSPASRQRWTRIAWTAGPQWMQGTHSTSAHPAQPAQPDAPARSAGRWWLSRDLAYYRHESPAPASGALQTTRMEFGRLSIVARNQHSTRQYDGALPEQFVPGALLRYVLERAPDQTIALRTEWMLSNDGAAAPGPLTLLVEPRHDSPRFADDGRTPLRCLAVTVSGIGEVERWHFDAADQLRYIDLSGGWRIQREDTRTRP